MAPLQGLTGLSADPQDTTDTFDEGVLEARANPLATEHGQYGSQSVGYQGTVPSASPYSNIPVYDGYDPDDADQYGGSAFRVYGQEIDQTPDTHRAPYPRGLIQVSNDNPDALAVVAEQMRELHGPDMGGPRLYNGFSPTGREEPTDYTTDRYDAPNENYLASAPGQLKGSYGHGSSGQSGLGGGNADTTQGYGVLNTLPEFQVGHSIRRVQHGRILTGFDYTNLHGEQDVPFYGRHPVQQMPLDGPDSPYFSGGSIDGANIVWEGRIGDPSPYVQAPEPDIAPSAPSGPDVFAWG
jgi:hypothetical protein